MTICIECKKNDNVVHFKTTKGIPNQPCWNCQTVAAHKKRRLEATYSPCMRCAKKVRTKKKYVLCEVCKKSNDYIGTGFNDCFSIGN